MLTGKTHEIPPTMARARRRFERWRKTRAGSSPIPDTLWALAVGMARQHGVNQTAQLLRLNYTALKERVEAANNSGTRRQRPSARFVELVPSALSPYTIELENAQGLKMKIQVTSPQAADWVALARSFWSMRS